MKLGKQAVLPTRAEIRARAKPYDTVPVEVQTCLSQTVWEPMKSRQWQAVMERINPDRTFLNGRK